MQRRRRSLTRLFFFFNDTATTEIYTLSLHDALPIYRYVRKRLPNSSKDKLGSQHAAPRLSLFARSEEHTSELQSHLNLVCRLLLEKKNKGRRIYREQRQRRGQT